MLTGGASGYAAIHSRVRVMYAALLTTQDESRLSELTDLPALVGYLKNTAYGPYLVNLDENEISPRQLLGKIKNRIADVYQSVIRSAPEHTRPLLLQLYRHFEVDNLKAILRGIVIGATWEQVGGILFPLGSLTVLPAQKMLETGKIEAAVMLLSNTPYYGTITSAMRRYTEENSLFPLEVALDLDYWRTVWKNVNQLPRQDRVHALSIVGPLVDMHNLLWAMRYRVYHHLSEEEIINYTLPIGYHIHDEDIRAIAAGADIAGIVERVYSGLREVEGIFREGENALPKLEILIQQQNRQHLTTVFSGYPFHIGLPLALLMLLELELQDLTVLIEAKDAHLKTEEFDQFLLLGTNSGNPSLA